METLNPVLLSELGDYVPIEWFWYGYIAPFRKTIFVASPKSGKTTLMSHLVKGFSGRTASVGPKVLPTTTLIVTEEHEDLWKRRRDTLDIDGSKVWIQRIFRAKDLLDWKQTCLDIAKFCREKDVKCVIIDTLSSLWPVDDENDAAKANAALDALNVVSDSGIALVCIHHTPKSQQSARLSVRGSGAIAAFFDVLINMRPKGRGLHTTYRSLVAWGRDLETPEKLILDYQGEDGYTACEELDEELLALDLEQIVKAVPICEPGIEAEAIRSNLHIAHVTLKPLLETCISSGLIYKDGKGVRGNPYTYIRAEVATDAVPQKE